jgi:S-adenosylmethionine:tRNA-ribosyltransferase-isomerase (queuine synthetase)
MAANFEIRVLRNNGSLHLKLSGDFDGTSAHELVNVLKNYSRERLKIFIHTDRLANVHSFGQQIFRSNIGVIKSCCNSLEFTGNNASKFAF